MRRKLLPVGTRKAIDVLLVRDTVMAMVLFGETGGEREMTEEVIPQKSAGWPDVLVRRGGSVAVARAVHRKMRLSPNTSATTSFRAERRIISKDRYTILCNVMLTNYFVLFLRKFGLGSPEKFSAAPVSISSPIPSLRAL